MTTTTLSKFDRKSQGFCWVRIVDAQGAFVRAFEITPEQYAALSLGGTKAAVDMGVSADDWESGRAIAKSGMRPGEFTIKGNGSCLLKLTHDASKGDIVQDFVILEPGEYSIAGEAISVQPSVLTAMDKSKLKLVGRIDSIDNGQIQWQSR